MNDVFLSYAREDQAQAQRLAAALEAKGWEVWWDKHIPPGKTFDEVIQEALDNTHCVVVLWSERSIRSNWVKEEAAEGAKRNILVPCLIDDIRIPLGFGRIQTASLVGWNGEQNDPDFEQLCTAVAAILDSTALPTEPMGVVDEEVKDLSSDIKPAVIPEVGVTKSSTEEKVAEQPIPDIADTDQAANIAKEPSSEGRVPSLDVPDRLPTIFSLWRRFRTPLLAALTLASLGVAYVALMSREPDSARVPSSGGSQAVAVNPERQQSTSGLAEAQFEEEDVRDFVHDFIAAANRTTVEAMLPFYAREVDFLGAGLVDHNFIRTDKELYFRRWPIVKNWLVDEISISASDTAPKTWIVNFKTGYEVQSPERDARASGRAFNTLTLGLIDGELKILSERQSVHGNSAS